MICLYLLKSESASRWRGEDKSSLAVKEPYDVSIIPPLNYLGTMPPRRGQSMTDMNPFQHRTPGNPKYNPKCRFHQLVSTTMDATQSLALQYHFNPENSPSGDPRLIRAIVSLRVALDKSRAEETGAEQEWKQQWKVSSVRQSSLRWL
ncbi:Pc09g00260 [Penicillium rubens Wisconsin 54-1255]|uniref:Pc09g00260 protein n=1 Tax=Penicillium rubens (strain ATCC 28089 / DSM 1075 / NRRL 1951 / Wisconsin 54-1255) TaxID=500485 RepID=B6GWM1_PENRW|nr:Pc09g00260 [Penicillium rubens Wisconsin 54-1255]